MKPRTALFAALAFGLWGGPFVMAATDAAGEPRFAAPSNETELKERVSELRAEYAPYLRSLPQPLPERQRTALPVEWKFTYEAKESPKAEGIPPAPAWQGVDFDDAKWETTTVPEWRYRTRENDDTAREPDKVAQWKFSGTTADTICWYRTTFPGVTPAAGKRLWLCFDGVEWEAQVYLNGELLGTHRVYYEPFRFDVTGKLKETNTLAVRVISGQSYGQPISYWTIFPDIRAAKQRYVPDRSKSIPGNLPIGYHSGCGFGIFQDVYLEQTGPARIDAIFARNDLSDGITRVKIELDGKPEEVRVEIMPENFKGSSYKITGRGTTLEIPMPDAKVWSPESPYLYRCRVTVPGSDAKDVLFGCRSFTLIHHKEPPEEYTFAPVKARWLRIVGRGSDKTDWNSIWEVSGPALVRTPESVTSSKVNKEYPAKLALDGKMNTRWSLQGRGEWIQFKLDDTVACDRVKIDWFEARERTWDFDLLISQDGQSWTKLDYKKPEAPPAGEWPSGMLMLNGKPAHLRATNIHGLNAYSYWGQADELLRTLLLLKAGNFNCVRSCQYVQFPEVRELLDRLGIMSEQDQGAGYRSIAPWGAALNQITHTGTVLARETYNNPGVVLLSFGNEMHYQTEKVVRAALAVDPQRVFKPISGRFTHKPDPWGLPEDLRTHAIDDGHPYEGWYGNVVPQTWYNVLIYPPRRLVTLGEYGAEGLDAYETMRDHYPPQLQPPAPDTDTLWASAQVEKHDVKQIAGLGRKPKNLAEYIEASQNYQESLLADKTIGYRLSPRAIAGYFQFHFMDVVPVHWPKSIVSHDHRPKKAYYQMAQINQPIVPLFQMLGEHPDAMKLWVANDLSETFPGATIRWTVSHAGKVLLAGQQTLDVPAVDAMAGQQIDLLPVTTQVPQFDVELTLSDKSGTVLSRYRRTVRVVPPELLKTKKQSVTVDPFNQKAKPSVPAGPPLSSAITPATVLTAMERVANWQLANPSKHKTTDWTQGAGYAGFMALAGISKDTKYREAMLAMGRKNQWKPGPFRYHADEHCVGQTYVELYLLERDPAMIDPLRNEFDFILANPPKGINEPHNGDWKLWSWCDALFMAPPAWVMLSAATGDPKYLDYGVQGWWRTTDYLYDKQEHLYYRDSKYFGQKEANGKKVFWGRGNGWVMGGLVRVLQYLPKDHPDRPRFEQLYKDMSAKILTCQQPDGLWRASLLDPDKFTLKETSGSGFYTYALAWGVNHGLLDRAQFEPAVRKAWAALVECVAADGKLMHVQPIGESPLSFKDDSTEIYGVGAFLLAGSEMYRMASFGNQQIQHKK